MCREPFKKIKYPRMKFKKHIIVFRSNSPTENTYLIKKLDKLNYQIKSYPILNIKKTYNKKITIKTNDIVLTTSFNTIFYLSTLTSDKNFQLYTLGRAATLLAKKLGFKNIIECSGDSGNILTNFISNNQNNKDYRGNIIYVGAKEISFNLPEKLGSLGYAVKRYQIYKTETISKFSTSFVKLVKNKNVSWIILLSSKGAKAFHSNAKKVFNKEDFLPINFACISKNVALNLNEEYFKTFYPKKPNINYVKKIILKYEKKYG